MKHKKEDGTPLPPAPPSGRASRRKALPPEPDQPAIDEEADCIFSHLAHTLEAPATLHYTSAVQALQAAGNRVFNLTTGDFDPTLFQIPMALKKEVMKAFAEDYTTDPAPEGNADLRRAISSFEMDWNGISYSPEEILVGSGVRPLIYALFRTLCDPDDVVLYSVPSWNAAGYTQLVGARPVEINTLSVDGFLPTLDRLRPHLAYATLLCLCSPLNPAGTGFTPAQLSAICAAIVRENSRRQPTEKKLYLLYDALYGNLGTPGCHHLNPVRVCPDIRPWIITMHGASKLFAATGMRLGWCLGPAPLLNKMKHLLGHMGAQAPMAEQKALARFLPQHGEIAAFLKTFKAELTDRLETLTAGLRQLHLNGYAVDALPAQGGLYLSVQIDLIGRTTVQKRLTTAADVADYLLKKTGVAVLPFSAFGAPEHLPWFRLSVGTCRRHDLPVIIKAFQTALEPYKMGRRATKTGATTPTGRSATSKQPSAICKQQQPAINGQRRQPPTTNY